MIYSVKKETGIFFTFSLRRALDEILEANPHTIIQSANIIPIYEKAKSHRSRFIRQFLENGEVTLDTDKGIYTLSKIK